MSSRPHTQYCPYSWHQSHDQATILLMVPYETTEDNLVVVFEQNYLLVGLEDQDPLIKGRLHGSISASSSTWQLEPRSRYSARERTTSTTSTISSQSSYTFLSDPETSSFAASLDSYPASDNDEPSGLSTGAASPYYNASDRRTSLSPARQPTHISRPISPRERVSSLSSVSSSFESLHNAPQTGRLLTLYLDKAPGSAYIWPSLITGPIPETMSSRIHNTVISDASDELEHKYNIDPHSLVVLAQDLYDNRKNKEEAFEYFVRAWHQVKPPVATMKLVTWYVPIHLSSNLGQPDIESNQRGTVTYYIQCIGGPEGLARLYLEAGLIHLEGAASSILSSSTSGLASIRLPPDTYLRENDADAWKQDREAAGRYFDRARILDPALDIPPLPSVSGPLELEMPSLDFNQSTVRSSHRQTPEKFPIPRRQRKDIISFGDGHEEVDPSWYLYLPGLVGAGTALLAVCVLSFSSWRRNHGS